MKGAARKKLSILSIPKWHCGQLMAFSGLDGRTDHKDGLVLRTTAAPAGLQVVNPAKVFIAFGQPPEEDVHFSNDFFSFRSASGQTKGAFLDAHHVLISGPVRISGEANEIRFTSNASRVLVGTAAHFDPTLIDTDMDAVWEARSRWLLDQPILEIASGQTQKTLFRALSIMKGQVYTAEGALLHRWTTPDRWPHKDMWLWDSVFHAIGWRHVDPVLAREMIEAVFDFQRADGFIPHRMSPSGKVSEFTQPPILAYGVKLVNEIAPNIEWVRRNYPKLVGYIKWDLANRDVDGGGLVEWLIEEDPLCRSGESGMDNSPRFDSAVQLDAVDFNSFLALECEILAEFADALEYEDDSVRWRREHKRLCRLIDTRLWSEANQFYCDYDPNRSMLTTILSSAGFLPLICGAATPEKAGVLAQHLRDPGMFATAFPVPSIAVRDQEHYSKDMWRGPTWVNMNWLIARGLTRYGFTELAESLDAATVRELERTCEAYGTFFEYFDDRGEVAPPRLLRKGVCAPELSPSHQVIYDYGWTTTLYVDLVMKRQASVNQNGTRSLFIS